MKCRRILGFFVLAVIADPLLCAPVTKTDLVTPRNDGATQENKNEEAQHKTIDDEDGASNFLKKYGYSNPGISKNSGGYKDELKESIKRMQKFHGLKVTGELDNDTVTVMNSPRCSLPDIITGTDGRQKRFAVYSKWSSNSVTYRIDNYPSSASGFGSPGDIDAAIDAGLRMWTQYANLYISKSQNANMKLGFYSGNHGDSDPFDGRGGTLAHAFFPPDGRIHFDNSETWSKTNNGYNLQQVTTHEGGHALGLAHSTDSNSVMYPTYKYQTNFMLGSDDIRGIQYLYGSSNNPPATLKPTTTTTVKPWTWNWFWKIFWG